MNTAIRSELECHVPVEGPYFELQTGAIQGPFGLLRVDSVGEGITSIHDLGSNQLVSLVVDFTDAVTPERNEVIHLRLLQILGDEALCDTAMTVIEHGDRHSLLLGVPLAAGAADKAIRECGAKKIGSTMGIGMIAAVEKAAESDYILSKLIGAYHCGIVQAESAKPTQKSKLNSVELWAEFDLMNDASMAPEFERQVLQSVAMQAAWLAHFINKDRDCYSKSSLWSLSARLYEKAVDIKEELGGESDKGRVRSAVAYLRQSKEVEGCDSHLAGRALESALKVAGSPENLMQAKTYAGV